MPRRHLNLTTKLAAALLALRDRHGDPLIPYPDSKEMTATQIVSLFQFDHYPIRAEAGGPGEPWNLEPRLIRAHRIKTSKIDAPEIAKIRHITKAEEQFRTRLLAKDRGEEKPRSKWASRPMRRK